MPEPPPSSKRSGSERRQRSAPVSVRFLPDERAVVEESARTMGLSVASFIRTGILGAPGPRAQRAPHVNAEELARATAALNKIGSNLNQLSRAFNSGATPVTAKECDEILKLVRQAVMAVLDIVARKERL
jgi:hypothetical protein